MQESIDWSFWNQRIVNELIFSYGNQAVVGDGLVVCGTPVYRGVVRGTVRVALDLEQARSIGHGDILVTRSTDIGWSPYFPLLKGVVTELGGLISHGKILTSLPSSFPKKKPNWSFSGNIWLFNSCQPRRMIKVSLIIREGWWMSFSPGFFVRSLVTAPVIVTVLAFFSFSIIWHFLQISVRGPKNKLNSTKHSGSRLLLLVVWDTTIALLGDTLSIKRGQELRIKLIGRKETDRNKTAVQERWWRGSTACRASSAPSRPLNTCARATWWCWMASRAPSLAS